MGVSWGNVPAGSVIPFFFDTFDGGTGASITLTGLAVTDIEVYKGTSMTQRASDAGYALLDTDGIDVDGITGIHGFSIDTGDNTDAGFYAAGSFYTIVVASVTIDGQTVNFVAGTFRLTVADNTAGTPVVDVGRISNDSTAADNCELMFDGTGYAGGTTKLGVDVTAISGDSTAADNLEAACDGNTYNVGGGAVVTAAVTGAVGSVTGNVGGSVASVAANGITATSIAADAINAAAVKADAVTKIQNGLATPTNITAGTITTVTNLTNAPTNGDLTATMKASVTTAATAATPTAAAVTGNVGGSVASVTAGVSLADDAITAAKFDESTAFPLKSADTGATAIARTGADSDTLETLSDQLDSASTFDASSDAVLIGATQGAITFGQIKIECDVDNEGALQINNEGDAGYGIVAYGDTAISAAGYVTTVDGWPTVASIKSGLEVNGGKLDHLWEMTEDDGGVRRLTANALEEAPTGGSAPTAEQIRQEIDANSTQLAAILLDTGTTLDTLIKDVPTIAEFEARTIAAASYATAAALDAVDNFVDTEVGAIKAVTDKLDTALEQDGAVYRYTTNALEQAPTGGGVVPTVEQIRQEMDANSTQLAAILEDTGTTLPALMSVVPSAADIDAALSSTHGAGLWGASGGASSVTYTLTSGGLPLAGVYCRMTTDSTGLLNVASGTTSAMGEVVLRHDLASGTTVYLWRYKAGYAFDDPDIEVI